MSERNPRTGVVEMYSERGPSAVTSSPRKRMVPAVTS